MIRFCSIDGDRIGATLEKLIISQDLTRLTQFSQLINETINKISQDILEKNYELIFSGGDNILFSGNFNISYCEDMSKYFEKTTSNKLSVGIGDTAIESFLALKIAKASGGAVIFDYCEIKNNE